MAFRDSASNLQPFKWPVSASEAYEALLFAILWAASQASVPSLVCRLVYERTGTGGPDSLRLKQLAQPKVRSRVLITYNTCMFDALP
jgi:hypothetical protein